MFRPSVADVFFLALLISLLGLPEAPRALLADGDTGWHIRTGETILDTRRIPVRDPYSFSRPGAPWFAWEWLAEVALAAAYRWRGLEGVVSLAGLVLCGAALGLFCRMARRGVGLWVAAAVTLAAVSASTVHYLARPHVFTLLLLPLGLWVLDEDRRRPGWRVWGLVPMAALWANLHGGFAAWLAVLGLLAASAVLSRDGRAAWRYGLLAALSALATLANPYGWELHRHIARYLGSAWIMNHVQEFQSPNFRGESPMVFAVLLFGGVMLVPRAWARREWFEGALVALLGLAALRSARHVPLYALVAAPLLATELEDWWRRAATAAGPSRAVRIFFEAGRELAATAARPTAWSAALAAVLLSCGFPGAGRAEFPRQRFPAEALSRHARLLEGQPEPPRVLTSDQWADYLIFRFYPRQRVFFDGRSDFYGPELGGEYRALMTATGRWEEILDRYGFEVALLPRDWALAAILGLHPLWRKVYSDDVAVLFIRRPVQLANEETSWHMERGAGPARSLKVSSPSTECMGGGG